MRAQWVAAAAMAAVLLTPAASAGEPARVPAVINGSPDSSDVAVLIDFRVDYFCTGSLWRPTVIVTAAHCLGDDDGVWFRPDEVRVWAPGADSSDPPSPVRVKRLVYDWNWFELDDDAQESRDVGFIILDRPLGAPQWDRLATPMEAATATYNKSAADFSGYGTTVPTGDPEANVAPEPRHLSTTFRPSYNLKDATFEVSADAATGTCAGDSGGPWTTMIADTRVLVGALSKSFGEPCGEPEPATFTFALGAVVSANTDLVHRALRLAGERPDFLPTTCISSRDVDSQCWEGQAWQYEQCSDLPVAQLWKATATGRRMVAEYTAGYAQPCSGDRPYRVRFRQVMDTATARFWVRVSDTFKPISARIQSFTVRTSR